MNQNRIGDAENLMYDSLNLVFLLIMYDNNISASLFTELRNLLVR